MCEIKEYKDKIKELQDLLEEAKNETCGENKSAIKGIRKPNECPYDEYIFGEFYNLDKIRMSTIKHYISDTLTAHFTNIEGKRNHAFTFKYTYTECQVTFAYGLYSNEVFETLKKARIHQIEEEIKKLQSQIDELKSQDIKNKDKGKEVE